MPGFCCPGLMTKENSLSSTLFSEGIYSPETGSTLDSGKNASLIKSISAVRASVATKGSLKHRCGESLMTLGSSTIKSTICSILSCVKLNCKY